MRAVIGHDFGGIDSLKLETTSPPEMTPSGVRIAIHAAGISFANLLVIKGEHQNKAIPPFTPGTEIAGVVTELGPAAGGNLGIGDRVCAGLPSGGFAEEAVVEANNVFRIPDSLPFTKATHFPTIYATAYCALQWRALIAPGETLLVHGGAGASGPAAVEVGAALGARVIATVGSAEKADAAIARGAAHAINYRDEAFKDEVLRLTEGRGVDVVFDPVGGDMFDQSLRCVAPLARVLTIGYASGRIPQIPANLILVKNISIIGLYWGFYMAWGKTQASPALRARARDMFDEMFVLFEEGKVQPVIDSTLPLADFAQGLRRIQSGKVIGKIVLVPER